ncbi:tail length tape measure protein [Xanthomonas phage NP1]|nr:tail length tape measure protein [Xanthomonas phage NP1]
MAVKLGDAPKTIDHVVKFKGTGQRLVFKVSFRNFTSTEFQRLVSSDISLGNLLVELITSWDAEIPLSAQGFADLEDHYPGVCAGFIEAWHDARRVAIDLN